MYGFRTFIISSATVPIFRDLTPARRGWMLPQSNKPERFLGHNQISKLPSLGSAAQHCLNTSLFGSEPFQAFHSERIKLPKKSREVQVQVSWLDLLQLIATLRQSLSELLYLKVMSQEGWRCQG
jgi:hypothetical protein